MMTRIQRRGYWRADCPSSARSSRETRCSGWAFATRLRKRVSSRWHRKEGDAATHVASITSAWRRPKRSVPRRTITASCRSPRNPPFGRRIWNRPTPRANRVRSSLMGSRSSVIPLCLKPKPPSESSGRHQNLAIARFRRAEGLDRMEPSHWSHEDI